MAQVLHRFDVSKSDVVTHVHIAQFYMYMPLLLATRAKQRKTDSNSRKFHACSFDHRLRLNYGYLVGEIHMHTYTTILW